MSYDIHIIDKTTDKTVDLNSTHDIKGGTYCVGGTNECYLNVTYNYSGILSKALNNENGINSLNGLNLDDSIKILNEGISKLSDEFDNNYWNATEGNVKNALRDLLILCLLAKNDHSNYKDFVISVR